MAAGGTLEAISSVTQLPGTHILPSHASFGCNMSPCMCSNMLSPLLPYVHSGAVAPLRLQRCLLCFLWFEHQQNKASIDSENSDL